MKYKNADKSNSREKVLGDGNWKRKKRRKETKPVRKGENRTGGEKTMEGVAG